jgi:hypothetical protein
MNGGIMLTEHLKRMLRVAALAALTPVVLSAQAPQQPAPQTTYKPVVGQEGKDAVWVPTSAAMVEKMLDHAKITPQDFVVDLGSGDGRTIIAAARRGTPGLGVEFNPQLVEFSKQQAAAAGVGDKASFVQGDMYEADISKATVMALFLLPSNIEKLLPKFLALAPGSRIVANTFWVSDWTPDDTQTLQEGCENWCTSHLFIVPAKVEGKWRLPNGLLTLTQRYQMVAGTFAPQSGTPVDVKGRLRGKSLALTVGDTEYEGSVDGNTIEGAAKTGNSTKVTATRIE